MKPDFFSIQGEYIQLNQLLKVLNWVQDGAEAHTVIDAGMVTVNGQKELRRRNKIYPGMKVKFQKMEVIIE